MLMLSILVVWLCAVNGIVLPGRFPESHSTQLQINPHSNSQLGLILYFRTYLTLFSVGFNSEHLSYVFNDPTASLTIFEMDDGKISKTKIIIYLLQQRHHHIFRVLGFAKTFESSVKFQIRLEYTKDPETVHCEPIEEEIRLWFAGECLFFWSCKKQSGRKRIR